MGQKSLIQNIPVFDSKGEKNLPIWLRKYLEILPPVKSIVPVEKKVKKKYPHDNKISPHKSDVFQK